MDLWMKMVLCKLKADTVISIQSDRNCQNKRFQKVCFRKLEQTFFLYRKFLKSSEIVYNRLEIKNDIAKERRGLRHDVVYEVFCFGLG
mgnify:FL=1